jgi:hypothetical protein
MVCDVTFIISDGNSILTGISDFHYNEYSFFYYIFRTTSEYLLFNSRTPLIDGLLMSSDELPQRIGVYL